MITSRIRPYLDIVARPLVSSTILQYRTGMDLSDPATALASGLTLPILRALAARSSPATAAQLHRVAGEGTEAGVRRALERLARYGILRREQVGDRAVYSLNDDHVLHPAVVALLRAGDELPRRLREEIASWEPAPAAAALYGSAARGDGDMDSDVDVLLVRPRLSTARQREQWDEQVHQLRDHVYRWTGNTCQVTDRSLPALRRLAVAKEPIMDAWRGEAVALAGPTISELLDAS